MITQRFSREQPSQEYWGTKASRQRQGISVSKFNEGKNSASDTPEMEKSLVRGSPIWVKKLRDLPKFYYQASSIHSMGSCHHMIAAMRLRLISPVRSR